MKHVWECSGLSRAFWPQGELFMDRSAHLRAWYKLRCMNEAGYSTPWTHRRPWHSRGFRRLFHAPLVSRRSTDERCSIPKRVISRLYPIVIPFNRFVDLRLHATTACTNSSNDVSTHVSRSTTSKWHTSSSRLIDALCTQVQPIHNTQGSTLDNACRHATLAGMA
jgi:hypothetical protein